MNLKWYVLYYNPNTQRIEQFNIFDHHSFNKAVMEIFSKSNLMDFTEFEDAIEKEAMYYFWSKAEYEVLVGDWISKKAEQKMDIYGQINMNWDRFIEYLWTQCQFRIKYGKR